MPSVTTVWVANELELEAAVRAVRSRTEIVLAPGTYRLRKVLVLAGPLSDITLRGATGSRDDVVLVGSRSAADADRWTETAVRTSGSIRGLTIAHVTIRDFSHSSVVLSTGVAGVHFSNVRFVDAGRFFIKATAVPEVGIDDCSFEVTETRRAMPASAVDVSHGADWVVRRSVFKDFRTLEGAPVAPTVVFRPGSSGGDIQRNTFVNCQLEVLLASRGGLVRNNFVVREPWVGGHAAISLVASPFSQVLHNSILLNGSWRSAIEVAGAASIDVVVQNNLTDGAIVSRGGASAKMAPNETAAGPGLFVNALEGDLHLLPSATSVIERVPVVRLGGDDWDGEPRPRVATDYGADELPAGRAGSHAGGLRTGGGSESQGALSLNVSPSSAVSVVALPSPWLARDLGKPASAGTATYAAGRFTVSGAGASISGSVDQFRFVYRLMTGDFAITARLESFGSAQAEAKAGVMIRQSLDAGSANAMLYVSGTRGLGFQRRLRDRRRTVRSKITPGAGPHWVRLRRRGSTLLAYYSTDGGRWRRVGSVAIAMSAGVYLGLAVNSDDRAQTSTATFTNVDVSSVPPAWGTTDIGSPRLAGAAVYRRGAVVVKGAGTDIWGSSDQFRFVYRRLTGDGEFTARVSSLQNTHGWAKAGLMIRENLGPEARHASAFVTPSNGLAFQRRKTAGASTVSTGGGTGPAPAWLRLARNGSEISAYRSTNGRTWTLIGRDTLTMPRSLYVGFAVTSHAPSVTGRARFTHVSLKAGRSNRAPVVSLAVSGGALTFTAPTAISLVASAADPDGRITRVYFYANSKLIGFSARAPFNLRWSDVPVGGHTLQALAQDDRGTRSVSTPVRITVVRSTAAFRTLTFTPSADHERVMRYVFEVFKGGTDARTSAPVAAQSLSRPPTVSGRITVDVEKTIIALPSGTYYATVSAVGVAGSSRSAPSNSFNR